ncbi:hypothetical protein L486_05900 [Kwoniella mangroviensis CBS 10435]|uniref:Uncharacterized protein n=1 Tax=Kwoniella mangroviensis CBS 10435 TaxID=1331196 RepID=A0A1B9INB0_9TREE|nr:uncharacterized protein I203_03175 [Kwoniella mangroviensis CBS 8507]OCF57043.1 hypothetical protein L486_05900 [Kwoniella mangroviensis CBS 10435]OCF67480.1 hypothetical protein I203_03175 [Kwoniella mangroviensis CBS 8507]OCF72726.1 hypothetical protein I204_05953 [Kwoniella mangroviensis CBS 8886]
MSNQPAQRKSIEKSERSEITKKSRIDHCNTPEPIAIRSHIPNLIASLQTATEALQDDYDKNQEERQSTEKWVSELEKVVELLRDRRDELEKECDELDEKYDSLDEKYRVLQSSEAFQKNEVKKLKDQLTKEKSKNEAFSIDKRKMVSDMLGKNKEWLNDLEGLETRAKVAFSEMNKARKKNGDPPYSKEDFEKLVKRYI